MKNIELTEEHKKKLLEMCEVLFPEYGYPHIGEETNSILFTNKSYPTRSFITIHWFEFCINIIPKYLKNNHGNLYFGLGSGQSILEMFERGEHPVDYIHKVFKKLKND